MLKNNFIFLGLLCLISFIAYSEAVLANDEVSKGYRSNILKSKIYQSLGKDTFDQALEHELTVDEIDEALALSCYHSPRCSRRQYKEIKARKKPPAYTEKDGMKNALAILKSKGMSPVNVKHKRYIE